MRFSSSNSFILPEVSSCGFLYRLKTYFFDWLFFRLCGGLSVCSSLVKLSDEPIESELASISARMWFCRSLTFCKFRLFEIADLSLTRAQALAAPDTTSCIAACSVSLSTIPALSCSFLTFIFSIVLSSDRSSSSQLKLFSLKFLLIECRTLNELCSIVGVGWKKVR